MADDTRNLDPNAVALTSGGTSRRLVKAGDIIGDSYRIKSLIGKGGMGYVFRAEHLIMGNDYALKMLAPDQINEVTWSRFQAEGKAIARLDHPNIVKIYNMGVDQGMYPYYVMDLLDGVALSDCIADKLPLTLDDVLDMFIQLAAGFGYAHGRGIIHRDVKPSNVVLVDSGGQYPTAKIVDFGIAKLVGNGSDFKGQSQTATGDVFGSPYYMSPEQCLGTDIDHRADIYSLGCTLFEALAGTPPFAGQTAMATVLMHQNKPSPSLESVSGKYWSEEMEALVAKMLMKNPADRYQSMEQVRHDLERIQQHKAVGKNVETGFISSMESQLGEIDAKYDEEQAKSSRRKKILLAAAVVVAGGAVTVATYMSAVAVKPVVKAPDIPVDSSLPSLKGADVAKMKEVAAPSLAKAKEKLDTVPSIYSKIDPQSGVRIFYCPNFECGVLSWSVGPANLAGIDTDLTNDRKIPAIGKVRVPADKPIELTIDMGRNSELAGNPGFLAKFGPSEFKGLRLTCEAAIEDYGDDAIEKAARDKMNDVMDGMAGWKELEMIDLYKVPITNHVLDIVDKSKKLKRFVARQGSIDVSYFVKRKFVKNLASLEMAYLESMDPILEALRGSTALKNVYMGNASGTSRGLNALASCPNLTVLNLDNIDLDSDAISAIANIKSLRRLRIARCRAGFDQFATLLKLKNIEGVDLQLMDWTPEQKEKLWDQMPSADPRLRRKLMRIRRTAPAP